MPETEPVAQLEVDIRKRVAVARPRLPADASVAPAVSDGTDSSIVHLEVDIRRQVAVVQPRSLELEFGIQGPQGIPGTSGTVAFETGHEPPLTGVPDGVLWIEYQ